MDNRERIRKEIQSIEDRIRLAPEGTSNRQVYEWYTKIDSLRDTLDDLPDEPAGIVPDSSNVVGISNADMEDSASETSREDFVEQWNADLDEGEKPQTWSQIVGTAK